MPRLLVASLFVGILLSRTGLAQIPAERTPIREIPPAGIDLPAAARTHLNKKRVELTRKIAELTRRNSREVLDLLPDVEIFARAAQLAIDEKVLYSEKEFNAADKLLDIGLARAAELMKGTSSWTQQTGLVVRGYRSRIDDTVQPYGLVIGPDVKFDGKPLRCDIWFHGRYEKNLEIQFLNERLSREGEYPLQDGIVLHPFGRFSNAFRFAGEVDVLEALENVKQHYNIDDNRIAVGGFSMGGAACWDFTVHYPSRWFASYPGAGFSETRRFLGMDKKPETLPPEYQQKLWTLYDAETMADNLFDVPTTAYSGEHDGQKLASDVMVEAAAKYGMQLPHVIGPEMKHKLHPDSKKQIAQWLSQLAEKGRNVTPQSLRFTTYSLKYNNCAWMTINGLNEHWAEAFVHADLDAPQEPKSITLKTQNVTDVSVEFPDSTSPFAANAEVAVTIDGQKLPAVKANGSRALQARYRKVADKWTAVKSDSWPEGLVKRHNLQGPVDDALMDSFLFVKPTSNFISSGVGAWVNSEMNRATKNWERQMRGNARTKRDTEITDADIRDNNLILWGCPRSNAVIKKIADQLPIKWTGSELSVGNQKYDPNKQVLIMVYPNPLNPERYIVLNSSLTYREFDYLNNARQTPKLPDWAVVDLSEPADDYLPGKILSADFFNEHWQLKAAK